ncbi:MAG: hypothetical protein KDK39_03255 [Leptospiraceae bacterium]|nr:hypothetical protein [Leptospiraceae bacterium]
MKRMMLFTTAAAIIAVGCFTAGLTAESKLPAAEVRDRIFKCTIASKPYEYMFLNEYDVEAETVSLYGIQFGMYTGGTRGALFYSGFMPCVQEVLGGSAAAWSWGDFSPLQRLSGLEPLLHKNIFASVNPRILSWGSDFFLPQPAETIDGVSFQKIYDVVLARSARLMTESYLYVRYQKSFDQEQLAYARALLQGDRADMMTWLDQRYAGVLSDYMLHHERYGLLQPSYAIGFWLRRGLDQSAEPLWQLHLKAMRLYDNAWLQKTLKQYPLTID